MIPNQPPQISSGFNAMPNFPPSHISRADLGRILMAALMGLAALEAGAQNLPDDLQAVRLQPGKDQEAAKPPGSLVLPTLPEEEGAALLLSLAKIIAKAVSLEKFSFGQKMEKPPHEHEKKGVENKEQAKPVESPVHNEKNTEKVNPQAARQVAIVSKTQESKETSLIEKQLLASIKLPHEKPPSQDSKVQADPSASQNLPKDKPANELQNLKNEVLAQHQWLQLKSPDIPFLHKPLPAKPSEKNSDLANQKTSSDILSTNKIAEPKTPVIEKEMTENRTESSSKERPRDAKDRSRIESDVAVQKKIEKEVPRADFVIPQKKDEDIPQGLKPVPFPTEQVPINIEQPLNREGILRYSTQNRSTRLKPSEGYRFGDLVLMAFCAILCGAKSSIEICRYLESREKFFTVWLGLKGRLPSFRLFWFLLNRLNPGSILDFAQRILSGKASDLAIHVYVWESNKGLIFGELNGDVKLNEDTLANVLYPFELKRSVITAEAADVLFSLSRQVRRKEGNSILALSEEQGPLFDNIKDIFESEALQDNIEIYKNTVEDPHHIEIREIRALNDLEALPFAESLPGRFSAIRFSSESLTPQNRLMTTRYYLSTLNAQPEQLSKALRILSLLEAKVQWLLDCDFIYGDGIIENEKDNIALLDSMAAQLILSDSDGTLASNRKKALSDNQYLRTLILGL